MFGASVNGHHLTQNSEIPPLNCLLPQDFLNNLSAAQRDMAKTNGHTAVCLHVAYVYVKWETGVRKTNWLSGQGLFANQPADTVRSLLSDRRLSVADITRRTKQTGTNRLSGHGSHSANQLINAIVLFQFILLHTQSSSAYCQR